MASVKNNITANFAGSAWSGLMSLIFVPLYIKLMGVEAYGLIGIYASLQAIFSVLDLGLSQTLGREMSRLSVNRENEDLMSDTARTMEVIYWGIALALVLFIVLLSNFIAYHWLKPEHLSQQTLLESLWIMGLVMGLRWPSALYIGGLNGLQRQVLVNVLISIIATLQAGGALVVLWLIAPTVQAFFVWQAFMALIQMVVLRVALWRSLPAERSGVFSREVLRGVWRFAAGMTGISLVGTILTQVDKILLSKLLTLVEFGYYTFAATVATVLYRIIGPVFTTYFPRLIVLVSTDDQPALIRTYHQGCQLMSVVTLPLALIMVFFSKELLDLWVRNPEIVAHCSLLVSLLVLGNAMHGLMHLPYALQLAHGWTKLSFYLNVVAVIVLVPAIYFATLHWGAVGAAGVWIFLNGAYLSVGVHLMHRRLIMKEKWNWYLSDIGKPLIAVLIITGLGRLGMGIVHGDALHILTLVIVLGTATVAAVIRAESLRSRLLQWRI